MAVIHVLLIGLFLWALGSLGAIAFAVGLGSGLRNREDYGNFSWENKALMILGIICVLAYVIVISAM